MRRLLLGGALLLGTCMSSAAEVQFDEHTLCPAAVRAFDGKDSPAIREFLRFVQNVFDELDARYAEKGAPALGQNSLTRARDRPMQPPRKSSP